MTKELWRDWSRLRKRINSSDKKLCLIDFDGTLAPIAKTPALARISSGIRKNLVLLSQKPDWQVAAVSGRSLKDLRSHLGRIKDMWYIGNHGLEIKGRGLSVPAGVKNARKKKAIISRLVQKLKADFQCLPGFMIEDKGFSVSLHFRNLLKECSPAFTAALKFLKSRTQEYDLIWRRGKKVWEIGPNLHWSKGAAAKYLIKKSPQMLVVALGDDRSDEDMFREVNRSGFTVRVGKSHNTCANYYVRSQKDVEKVLEGLRHESS